MDKAVQTMIDNLEKQTGTSLENWVKIAKESGFTKHGEILKYLKSEKGLTHGYANLITLKARERESGFSASGDDLISAQYKGKETLKPIYDAIIHAIRQFGKDLEIAPKKTYVSLRRNKQFALVQPSTRTRVDVGINFKDKETTDRLEKSGSFNAMCSHRVRLESPEQVDAELVGWLREAYMEA